jgi:AraC family transcriptional activator of pyochelin receptor
MGFEVKNKDAESLLRQDFTEQDFTNTALHTASFDVSLPFGTMKATQWSFDGIRMIYSESLLNQATEMDWTGDTELVTMHFNLQGKLSLISKGMPARFELSGNEHNMFYGKEVRGKMRFNELTMKSFLIQFSKEAFFNIARDGNDTLKQFAEDVESGIPVAFSPTNLTIDLSLQHCIHAILNCTYADQLKRMFFFSKTIELLVLQAESFNKLHHQPRYIKDSYDKERILFARDHLLKNIECPPTLTALSKMAGINEFKLKRGFKETFNKTVFEYLSEVRLEMAKENLLRKSKSISQLADELGYSSLQHFSTAFKKKFGVSPSKVK